MSKQQYFLKWIGESVTLPKVIQLKENRGYSMECAQLPTELPSKYVAFCDVLGFSNAVLTRFEETAAIYNQFISTMRDCPFPEKARVSIYSDSILVVADELMPLIQTVQGLCFVALAEGLLLRGGVANGRHWEKLERGNLFVLSEALVRAVKLESSIRVPAVSFSEEITIDDGLWFLRFIHGPAITPVLHFKGVSLVNPFNKYWFKSARIRVSQLQERFPEHESKYSWFLALSDAVENDDPLVPESVFDRFLKEGVLKIRSSEQADES